MDPKPVRQESQPTYPTRREMLAGAAAFALTSLAEGSFVFGASKEDGILVAPIFAHGEGRGASGCVVVSPPVFLSEEEGMQILREELVRHDVELKAGSTIEGVRIPDSLWDKIRTYAGSDERKERAGLAAEDPENANPLKPDGMDSEKKIAIEFVALTDHVRVPSADNFWSSVVEYEFKAVAEEVALQAKKQGKGPLFFGVFYDPAVTPGSIERTREAPAQGDEKVDAQAQRKKQREIAKDESKKLLRQQAQDFVAWLKEQKAIK